MLVCLWLAMLALSEHHLEPPLTEPGDGPHRSVEPRGDQQRIVRPPLIPDHHLTLPEMIPDRGINEVTNNCRDLAVS